MGFNNFWLSCCECGCNPTFCVNLYDPFTLQSIPTDSGGGINLQVTSQVVNYPYQWPSGHSKSILSYPYATYTVSGYQNNTNITPPFGSLVPTYPIDQPLSPTGGAGFGSYTTAFGGANNVPCFGYTGTDVVGSFSVEPYPAALGSNCFAATTFCDIDICDSGHLCANVPYCPTLVNLQLDPLVANPTNNTAIYIFYAANADSGCFSQYNQTSPIRPGSLCYQQNLGSGYYSPSYLLAYLPLMKYNETANAFVPDYTTQAFRLANTYINASAPNYNEFAVNLNPWTLFCQYEALYFCPCVYSTLDPCGTISVEQNCFFVGQAQWVTNQQCPGTTDCCGNSVTYPGQYPQKPMQITINILYTWTGYTFQYQIGCEDVPFNPPIYNTIDVESGSTTLTIEGSLPYNNDCTGYGPACLPCNLSLPIIICPTTAEQCSAYLPPGTYCTDCEQSTIAIQSAYIAYFMPNGGQEAGPTCATFIPGESFLFYDGSCQNPASYNGGGWYPIPGTYCTCGFVQTLSTAGTSCGAKPPCNPVQFYGIAGVGQTNLCNGTIVFTSCDGTYLNATV